MTLIAESHGGSVPESPFSVEFLTSVTDRSVSLGLCFGSDSSTDTEKGSAVFHTAWR